MSDCLCDFFLSRLVWLILIHIGQSNLCVEIYVILSRLLEIMELSKLSGNSQGRGGGGPLLWNFEQWRLWDD